MAEILLMAAPGAAQHIAGEARQQGHGVEVQARFSELVPEPHRYDLLLIHAPSLKTGGNRNLPRLLAEAGLSQLPVLCLYDEEPVKVRVSWIEAGFDILPSSCDPELQAATIDRAIARKSRLQVLDELSSELGKIQSAKDGLIDKLAHDMKSPLTVMMIELGMLERWWEKGKLERFQQGVATLTDNCDELISMIQNLLDAGRLERGDLKIRLARLPIGTVLRECLDNPPSSISKREIGFRLDWRDSTTPVALDPPLLARAFTNFLKVAARLSGPKSTISIATRSRRATFSIRIETMGKTIEVHDASSLFDSYAHEHWRSLGLDAGAGVGLNLGRRIVEEHGGSVDLEVSADDTAIFTLQLPAAS